MGLSGHHSPQNGFPQGKARADVKVKTLKPSSHGSFRRVQEMEGPVFEQSGPQPEGQCGRGCGRTCAAPEWAGTVLHHQFLRGAHHPPRRGEALLFPRQPCGVQPQEPCAAPLPPPCTPVQPVFVLLIGGFGFFMKLRG